VRADTKVTLEFQGLTGLAQIALTGGAADAAPIAADGGAVPTLYADRNAGADVTQAAREVLSRIDGLVAENEQTLRTSLHNVETMTAALARNTERLDKVMAGVEDLTGSGDKHGEIGETLESIRRLADNLDKRTGEISVGLSRFSNSGLKEFEAFAADGRRTLAELNKAIKNIDEHPSRLIFGH
jgi:phospholipid/cholesterol/gamma-HCH transport system substrate-binding protein